MLDERVRAVLARLEADDARESGLGIGERSLAIAPTTGALLYALCVARPGATLLEIGGSRGYSTIWLGAAARAGGGRVTSLERDHGRLERAAANLADAGLDAWVDILEGDAFDTLARLDQGFDLVFLDAWKDDYERLFACVRPHLAPGAIVVADNVLSHAATLAPYSARRQADPLLLSVTVPLDSGLELTCVLVQASPS